jgi:hypothetical protein
VLLLADVTIATWHCTSRAALANEPANSANPSADRSRDLLPFPDTSGAVLTLSTTGAIDGSNPFFQSLGTNGRACITCHQPSDGWTITPAHIQARFDATGGLDPLFRPVDGANYPTAAYGTVEERRWACSMLLTKGLIRVGIGIPANAEFTLSAVDDPYSYASAAQLSLFRRPLPSTNLRFLSAVMWDGRQTSPGFLMGHNLMSQADDATLGHEQASQSLTPVQEQQIVNFESSLYTAQVADNEAGSLDSGGAQGGPITIRRQPFFSGINDPLGLNPLGLPFDPKVFTLYQAWANLPPYAFDRVLAARHSIARGERIFNTRLFTIKDVSGLNDELGRDRIQGTCTTCHDTPNVGNHSISVPLNIGISDPANRMPGIPLYTLRNNATGEEVQTTDPGRALVTGRWRDIGRFKGPILRALAARPPYFHNGFATTLNDVVNFYDKRFEIKLTPQEKADLVAFLRSL